MRHGLTTNSFQNTILPLERWRFRSDDRWDRLAAIRAKTLLLRAANSFVRGEVTEEMTARFSDYDSKPILKTSKSILFRAIFVCYTACAYDVAALDTMP